MAFCKEYNAKTADKAGMVIPVEVTIYDDKSFTLVFKASRALWPRCTGFSSPLLLSMFRPAPATI